MRKYTFLITGSLALFIITGCTTVRRFKTAQYKGVDNSLVEVTLFNASLSGEPVKEKEKNLNKRYQRPFSRAFFYALCKE